MCDYCACRRIPEIAALGVEHDRIEDLGAAALTALRSGEGAGVAAVEELIRALEPHVRREESGIFTQAREAGLGAYYVDDLEEDHRRFAGVLEHPDRLDADALEELLDELHHHIAIEEYDLFPATAQLFTESHWEAVERGEVRAG